MTQTQAVGVLSALDRDWLDALAILARQTSRGDVLRLNEEWKLSQDVDSHRLISISIDAGHNIAFVNCADYQRLPKIERVEIALYAATALYFGDGNEGGSFSYPREAFVNLCLRVGCHHTNTPSIRERWRLIDWATPAHLLPLARFEDRPMCQLCSSPIATGAGPGILGTVEGPERYRRDIHEECLRYAHRVLAPQLREARAADERMKTRAAGEVDK